MSARRLLPVGATLASIILGGSAGHAIAKNIHESQGARWTTAYRPGERDRAGHRMGGTELRALVPFEGKLYAGLGYWMEAAKDAPGAQVLVLGGADEPWHVDLALDDAMGRGPHAGERRYLAIGALEALTLTTDGGGKKLTKPAHLLVAGPWSRGARIDVFVRGEESAWTRSTLGAAGGSVRSFSQHVDGVTGVSRAFAGSAPLGIYSGVYVPAARTLAWEPQPEAWLKRDGRDDTPPQDWRVMSFAECNGKLFATAGPALYERHDGPSPTWERVYTATFPPRVKIKQNGGLRGLTAIKNPDGPGDVLLVTMGGPTASVLRVDPAHGFSAVVEQDVVALLSKTWHTPVGGVLLAYNNMTRATDPRTGELVHLLGLQAKLLPSTSAPARAWEGFHAGATYLVRRANGTYEVREMEDPTLDAPPPRVSVRTLALSPFARDVVYAGGFDANRRPVHDTAWALSAPLTKALGAATAAAR